MTFASIMLVLPVTIKLPFIVVLPVTVSVPPTVALLFTERLSMVAKEFALIAPVAKLAVVTFEVKVDSVPSSVEKLS